MLKETQHILIGGLAIGLLVTVFGCATKGELKALKEESHNESAKIQRALTEGIDHMNRQVTALRSETLAAVNNFQRKWEEMQRHEAAQHVVQETFFRALKTEQLALLQRLQYLNEAMKELEQVAQPMDHPVIDKPVGNDIPGGSSIKSK